MSKGIPEPEDDRLRSILYTMRAKFGTFNGLKKLVPTKHVGAPAFTIDGVSNSPHNDYYEPDCQEYMSVSLDVGYSMNKWMCKISITDGDDTIYQRWRDFTFENWQDQMRVYNEIDGVDSGIIDYLCQEYGFVY